MLYRWVSFFLILQSNVKTKEAIFIPNEITDFTRDRGRERVIRHCEGEIKDHHHVRPSPTFNPTSCHQYILLEPLLIQVSLNNKNWYQIWFRFIILGWFLLIMYLGYRFWLSLNDEEIKGMIKDVWNPFSLGLTTIEGIAKKQGIFFA